MRTFLFPLSLLIGLHFIACAGCDDNNSSSSPPPNPPAAPEEDPWFTYESTEAGFAIDALFEPKDISNQFEGQGGFKLALSWSIANPDYSVVVMVQELPISTGLPDAQRRILKAATDKSLDSAGAVPAEVVFETRNNRLFAIARTRDRKKTTEAFWLSCTAYKAIYMLAISGIDSDEAKLEAERILASFTILENPPTAIADAIEAENSVFYFDENTHPELLKEIERSLDLAEDPDRGVGYEGPYNQPELNELQTMRLRRIADALKEAWPIPWETWVYNIRMQYADNDESIEAWGKAAIAWQSLGDSTMSGPQKNDFLTAAYYAAKQFDVSKLDYDPDTGISHEKGIAIQLFIQNLDADNVRRWLDEPK